MMTTDRPASPDTTDNRLPSGEAHYRGDVRHTFHDRTWRGPDYNGEVHFPLMASYDEATDTTTVVFTKQAPAWFSEALARGEVTL